MPDGPRAFPTTQISLVQLAARPESGDEYAQAWERFFRAYWRPLHAFLVRSGSTQDEALDLLQDFFVEGLQGKVLRGYEPERGRLRTWLIACLKNVRRKGERRERARPDRRTVSFLDEDPGVPEPTTEHPEAAFEREWSRELAARSLEAVRRRLTESGDGAGLALLDEWVLVESRGEAAPLAARLGLTEGALYARATRLRHALAKEAEAQARRLSGGEREAREERDDALRALKEASR